MSITTSNSAFPGISSLSLAYHQHTIGSEDENPKNKKKHLQKKKKVKKKKIRNHLSLCRQIEVINGYCRSLPEFWKCMSAILFFAFLYDLKNQLLQLRKLKSCNQPASNLEEIVKSKDKCSLPTTLWRTKTNLHHKQHHMK